MSFDYHSYQSEIMLIVNHTELAQKAVEMGFSPPICAEDEVLTEEQLSVLRESGKCVAVAMFDPDNVDAGDSAVDQLKQNNIPTVHYDFVISLPEDQATLDDAVRHFPSIEFISKILIDRGFMKDRNHTDRCGNCHHPLKPGDKYCRKCGTERGKGAFDPFLNRMDVVYGPPIKMQYKCQACGHKWVTVCLGGEESFYCPSCGEKAAKLEKEVVGSMFESFDDELFDDGEDDYEAKTEKRSDKRRSSIVGKGKDGLKSLKSVVSKGAASVDVAALKEKAQKASETISDKAQEIKDSALELKGDIAEKLTELDRMLESSITEYNDVYTLMNDKGVQLFLERSRAVDTIGFVEKLINSIANHPKSFDADFQDIDMQRNAFLDTCAFGQRELQAAREAAGGAGAGLAAGASVAFMAPTAAMWVATTFGTASTGTAISTLSGAAASNAALAWLGGGALSAGGGGVAAGNALLAMAGPIGWTIAGATLLTSILLFSSKKAKLNKQKNEEIESVKKNTELLREVDAEIQQLLTDTEAIRTGLNESFTQCLSMFQKDYASFTDDQKRQLGALVNQTKALSAMFGKTIA